MNPKVWFTHTVSLAAFLIFLLTTPLWADTVTLDGVGLTEGEMADIRGGFTLDNGDFMALTLDYMKLQYVTQADPQNPNSGAWLNALSQQVRITEKGIEFGSNILQGGGGGNAFGQAMELQNNQVAVANSLTGFTGIGSGNFISGNYNTASIVNIFNIQMDIIKGADLATLKPELTGLLLQ